MVTISLCMIVKNEEEVLARCLDSVRSLVDEIVIVDTGSTDRTREIAARYTDRLYSFPWNDDFAADVYKRQVHIPPSFLMKGNMILLVALILSEHLPSVKMFFPKLLLYFLLF